MNKVLMMCYLVMSSSLMIGLNLEGGMVGVLGGLWVVLSEFDEGGNWSSGGVQYSSSLGFWLILLSLWVGAIMLMLMGTESMMLMVIVAMVWVLMVVFLAKELLWFYVWFEVSLVPIVVMIMGWGYQPERLIAFLSIMAYTVTASMPLLVGILWMKENLFEGSGGSSGGLSGLVDCVFLLAFVVKFPMYGVHLWLPKAHVEAPAVGSMVLAGVMLKLGGYGMILLGEIYIWGGLSGSVQMFSLWGGLLVGLLCLRQMDMKVLIAYSSVSHMSMIISGLISKTGFGFKGGLIVMMAHGVVSTGMFMSANSLYKWSHSRKILLNQGLLGGGPGFSLLFFMMCMGNMGAPPTLNFCGEFMMVISLVGNSWSSALYLGGIMYLAVGFTLVLYSGVQSKSGSGGVMLYNKSELMNMLMYSGLCMTVPVVMYVVWS